MVDKKVEDDYYSSIQSSTPSKKSAGVKKPFKVKAKKVIKKVQKTSETSVENTEKKEEPKKIEVQAKTGMKVVQRSTPNNTGTQERKPFVKRTGTGTQERKPFVKRTGTGTQERKPFVKRTGTGTQERKPFVKRTPYNKDNSSNSGQAYKKNTRTTGGASGATQERSKVFSNNKQKANAGRNKYSTPKNSALKPYNKGKKYGNKWGEPEEKVFARAKRNQSTKIEKKIEDIKQNLVERKGQKVVVGGILTLKELSEKIGVNLIKLIAEFMKNGMMVNINSKIDFDSASIVAEAFEVTLERDASEGLSVQDLMVGNIQELLKEDGDASLVDRPPVISIMGHVDHGKTSLLDQIRESAITDGEAGGITQSIGAYQVEKSGKKITFLDTPGHEAFTVMRARGAKSTDIAILVVAADEGVKPQTIESISHAKEAGIPVIVAINKMDKEGANPDHVKGQLAENGLTPEDWGGDTPMVPVSAKTGFGIDDLLEIVLLVAEMKELKANPDRRGVATIIESHLDSKLGPVSTVLVNTGTVEKGAYIVCNDSFGKIKVLKNFENKNVKKAFPGDPVLIVGLDKVANGGDVVQVVDNAARAKKKATEYRDIILSRKRNEVSGLEILMSRIKAGNLKQLKVVVKADSNGSLEALKAALTKLSTPETNVAIIHSGVGNITEGDVLMCSSSKAILIGFGVQIVSTAKKTIESEHVEYIESDIIYHITDRIEKIVSGMLDPKEVEIILGQAKVGGIFYTSKEFMVLGLILQAENNIETGVKVRVLRNKSKIGDGSIKSLKSGIEEVKSLEGPCECGIKFVGSIQPEMGDYLEIYKTEIQK